MADIFDKAKRSDIMSKIRCKNTKPELLLFALLRPLWVQGIRYRKHYSKIPGKPDIAFPKQKIAIFVDSEFWHGKDFDKLKGRLPNEYWKLKIAQNIERDNQVNSLLAELEWTVLRFWVRQITSEPEVVQENIIFQINKSETLERLISVEKLQKT